MTKISTIKEKADTNFSKYIRLRDAIRTTGTHEYAKCFTCDRVLEIKCMDAGHWRSRKYNVTRFDERNVQCQCKSCNGFNNGMQEEFRRELEKLYSPEVVDELYYKSKELKRFTASELEEIADIYKEKFKLLSEQ